MELNGTFTITSKVLESPVGRNPIEDKSYFPKKVIVLPKNFDPPKWELEALPDGNVIMKIGGGYTAPIDKLLFAILQDEPSPAIWKIEPQFHHGENTYTIVLANSPGEGWVVPADQKPEDGPQIAVLPLIVGLSFPPFHPPNQLFVITPV